MIEQITFLMFARLLDIDGDRATRSRAAAHRASPSSGRFTETSSDLRWKNFQHLGDAEEMLTRRARQGVPALPEAAAESTRRPNAPSREYMKDAQLMIQKPSLLRHGGRT